MDHRRLWQLLRAATAACLVALIAAPAQADDVHPGDPLPGLGAADVALFFQGRDNFNKEQAIEDGLGPAFNGTSCAICHSIPAIGGGGFMTETRAATRNDDGSTAELPGGSMFRHFSIPDHECSARIDPAANVIALRIALPIFGDGLVEAIPDATILALAKAEHGDRGAVAQLSSSGLLPIISAGGVAGRANIVLDPASNHEHVGRFGWKAQQATLLAFAGLAYRDENGITNDLFPGELKTGLDPATFADCAPVGPVEDVVDPGTGIRAIDDFANFMRTLAPPPRGPVGVQEQRGEGVFRAAGCASCHVPTLLTGPNDNPALDRRPVPLFSDLLLHDVGTGDGIPQDGAGANEIKTPPLWGLRFRHALLHDGRAGSLADAIAAHHRQAELAQQRVAALAPDARAALLAFLGSL